MRDPKDGHLVEVRPEGRERWEFPTTGWSATFVNPSGQPTGTIGNRRPIYQTVPTCAVGAMPISEEAGGEEPAKALPVISRERDCPGFIRWRRGFSPKEHQQVWMAEQVQKFQTEQNHANRMHSRWNVLLAGCIGLVGVLIGRRISPSPQPPAVNVQPAAVNVQPAPVIVNIPKGP